MERSRRFSSSVLPTLLILASTVFVLWPLLRQGALPGGDDTLFHLHFSDGMARGLQDGVLHPRWMSKANRGFGSAALMNYPPLGGYLVGAISPLTAGLLLLANVRLFRRSA